MPRFSAGCRNFGLWMMNFGLAAEGGECRASARIIINPESKI